MSSGSEIGRAFKSVGRHRPRTVENPPADSESIAGGDGPAWNNSTACLQTLQCALSARGWHEGQLDIPMYQGEMGSLPRRPPDTGVGLWR